MLSSVAAILIGGRIAAEFTSSNIIMALWQAAVGAVIGMALVEITFFAPNVAIAVTIGSQTLNVITYVANKYARRKERKALEGEYGELAQWGAEIIDEGDIEFAFAMNALSKSERKEIGIIAESKEELRELTVERFNEQADENIPEEFA